MERRRNFDRIRDSREVPRHSFYHTRHAFRRSFSKSPMTRLADEREFLDNLTAIKFDLRSRTRVGRVRCEFALLSTRPSFAYVDFALVEKSSVGFASYVGQGDANVASKTNRTAYDEETVEKAVENIGWLKKKGGQRARATSRKKRRIAHVQRFFALANLSLNIKPCRRYIGSVRTDRFCNRRSRKTRPIDRSL